MSRRRVKPPARLPATLRAVAAALVLVEFLDGLLTPLDGFFGLHGVPRGVSWVQKTRTTAIVIVLLALCARRTADAGRAKAHPTAIADRFQEFHGSSDSRMRALARDFQDPSSVPLAPKGRDISAQGKRGGVSRQALPWGSLFVREEALKGRHRRWLSKACYLGGVTVVSPFQGFQLTPPDTQGGAALPHAH